MSEGITDYPRLSQALPRIYRGALLGILGEKGRKTFGGEREKVRK
jgi:hypothetical protein